MPPLIDGTASSFGAYEPTLSDRIWDASGARWPFWLALVVVMGLLVRGAA